MIRIEYNPADNVYILIQPDVASIILTGDEVIDLREKLDKLILK